MDFPYPLNPVEQHHADTDPVCSIIVVNEALSIAIEVLYVYSHVMRNGVAPSELHSSLVFISPQVVAEHERKDMPV